MVFWRKKKEQKRAEEEQKDQELLHPKGEPELEPSTEYEAEIDENLKHELEEPESEIIEELEIIPVPDHNIQDDIEEAQEDAGSFDDEEEGGWLSKLTDGLGKSSKKFTQGISDLVTKKKLDQDTLDELEDLLIEADLGPRTAATVVERFSKDRFGKDISEDEVKEALAQVAADILKPVEKQFTITKPENGKPFVVLMCGVNGAGKTTTIGKLAYDLHYNQKLKVMMAAGDTFRAAALEQLAEWAKRVGCECYTKDIGADAASVAFEAYQKAVEEKVDVLFIDTAGRLQNKANLMEELAKIVRVLKKQDADIPHETLLVLDATTGQNAVSQVQTFGEMVDVTGLIVTKLDGSAKGGVLLALADQFETPVYKVGVGESLADLQDFKAAEFSKALMGFKGNL